MHLQKGGAGCKLPAAVGAAQSCSSEPSHCTPRTLQAFTAGDLLFKERPLAAIQHTANRAGGRLPTGAGCLDDWASHAACLALIAGRLLTFPTPASHLLSPPLAAEAWVCSHCFRFIGSIEQQIARQIMAGQSSCLPLPACMPACLVTSAYHRAGCQVTAFVARHAV